MRRVPLVPVVLVLLALLELRSEFLLLSDHFTLAAVIAAVRRHQLPIGVLVLAPELFHRFR